VEGGGLGHLSVTDEGWTQIWLSSMTMCDMTHRLRVTWLSEYLWHDYSAMTYVWHVSMTYVWYDYIRAQQWRVAMTYVWHVAMTYVWHVYRVIRLNDLCVTRQQRQIKDEVSSDMSQWLMCDTTTAPDQRWGQQWHVAMTYVWQVWHDNSTRSKMRSAVTCRNDLCVTRLERQIKDEASRDMSQWQCVTWRIDDVWHDS